MCDTFRRLILPGRQHKVKVLQLGLRKTDKDSCSQIISDLASAPQCCTGSPFVQNVVHFCRVNEFCIDLMRELMRDALLHIPATSVNVERLHACSQRNAHANKSGRHPQVVQQNSYVMGATLEHNRIREAAEAEPQSNKQTFTKFILNCLCFFVDLCHPYYKGKNTLLQIGFASVNELFC